VGDKADQNHSPADRPNDAADEIPGRAAHRPLYKALLVAVAFTAWLGVLVMLGWLGRP